MSDRDKRKLEIIERQVGKVGNRGRPRNWV